MTPARFDDLIGRLPHHPPMRLPTRVLDASGDAAVCEVEVGPILCELFGDGTSIDSYVGVEIIAQTAALALASRRAEGELGQGALVQVTAFEPGLASAPLGSVLRSEAKVDLGLSGQAAIVSGRVSLDGLRFCAAKLSIAIGAV